MMINNKAFNNIQNMNSDYFCNSEEIRNQLVCRYLETEKLVNELKKSILLYYASINDKKLLEVCISKTIKRNIGYNTEQFNILPSMHTSELYLVEKIFETKRISSVKCDVLGGNRLYFFYGKPSYKAGASINENVTSDSYYPVCFIFSSAFFNKMQIFPFDTGAFKGGLFRNSIHKYMELEEFELIGGIDIIRDYIAEFFTSNEKYVVGCAKKNDDEFKNSIVEALTDLLLTKGGCRYDDRMNTVEININTSKRLDNDLLAVIVPSTFERKQRKKVDSLREKGVEIIKYYVSKPCQPKEYNTVIYNKAMDFMINRGMIKNEI